MIYVEQIGGVLIVDYLLRSTDLLARITVYLRSYIRLAASELQSPCVLACAAMIQESVGFDLVVVFKIFRHDVLNVYKKARKLYT